MNQTKHFFVALACLLLPVLCFADGRIIPADQLPAAATQFIQQHFADKAIALVEMDRNRHGIEYEVKLNDGTDIDFDGEGAWTKVDCQYQAVPEAIVPAAIVTYVKANYPDQPIVQIDKERYGYKVEFLSDLELLFDNKFNFIGLDD